MKPPHTRSQRSRIHHSTDNAVPVPPTLEIPVPQDVIQSILRLVAVLAILVGVILATMSLVTLLGVNGALQNAPRGAQVQLTGMLANVGFYATLADVTIALWGAALFAFSPRIARFIAE